MEVVGIIELPTAEIEHGRVEWELQVSVLLLRQDVHVDGRGFTPR